MADVPTTQARRQPARVLLIAYKIRASTGSEDGSGYHIAAELIRRGCQVTLVSRKNNVDQLRGDPQFTRVKLIGVDVPRALGFFKRGGRGIILYYYLWQITVGLRTRRLAHATAFDVVHQLNFHTDWAPHFLWSLRLPVVWGPIAHHRLTPRSFFPPGDGLGYLRELVRAAIKRGFWYFDPLLRFAVRQTPVILYANEDFAPPFRRHLEQISLRPYAGSFARPANRAGESSDVFRVLWVGRLVAMKGPLVAIKAFERFSQALAADAPVELLLVGDGPLKKHAVRLSAACGLNGRVRMLDWLQQEQLVALYESSSVFLYPSVEAQGLVVAEALCFGLPTLTISGTGPAHLVGPAGWAVGTRDVVTKLADCLFAAHRRWQRDGLAAMRRAAGDRYDAFLDWPRVADDILLAYDRALAAHRLK